MNLTDGEMWLDSDNCVFEDGQIGLSLDDGLHPFGIFLLGALATRCPDGRSSAKVERLSLKGSRIGVFSHLAAERIKLADEMAFRQATNGRIARHPRDGRLDGSDEQGLDIHACGGQSGFNARMPPADNENVVCVRRIRLIEHGGIIAHLMRICEQKIF